MRWAACLGSPRSGIGARWQGLGPDVAGAFLPEDENEISQQNRRRRGLAAVQRHESILESEPPDGFPLWKDVRGYLEHVPPLLRRIASSPLSPYRDLE